VVSDAGQVLRFPPPAGGLECTWSSPARTAFEGAVPTSLAIRGQSVTFHVLDAYQPWMNGPHVPERRMGHLEVVIR
jgi:hypothetical protein